ncbi:MAG TPA: HEAT repeat domain-containing protein, partial [Myxococcota bacterium]|nr:HEAT repeat domain-containing protein [Myxococcota bacterium]
LGNLETGGFIDELLRLALATPKEAREPIERAVAQFGQNVVPGLVQLLATNEDASARKAACSMLVRVGEPAVRYLLDEMRARRHTWFTVRNLVQVLADIGNAEAVPVLVEQGSHPNPKVREESAAALARLAVDDAEALLLPFLEDRDEAVVRRAILHLSQLRSTASPFLQRMFDAIRVRSRDEEEPSEALQAACMRALMEYEKVLMPATPDFEVALVEIVAPPRFKTMLPGRLGIRPKSDGLVLLAIEALGFRGGGHTAQALTALAVGQDADKARAAQLALEALKRRQDGNPY